MQKLNWPEFDFRLSEKFGKILIFDPIRKKEIICTPEEWVRQHVLNFLLSKNVSRGLIKVEGGLIYNSRQKRSDILVFDREGKPYLLVECKAPSIKLTQKVYEQAATYNNTIKAPFLVVTNGLVQYSASIDHENRSTKPLDYIPIP